MGTTPLRRFLQSLCNNSCWNYAVFWKLQPQDQMFLIWEDGYFETLKVQDSMENMFAGTSFGGLEETSSFNTYVGTLGGDAVQLAVNYMSTFQYALGDGVIGDVAYTGNCRWVFAGSKSSGDFKTASIPEHADEWLFQFAAGVKTILLVPVIPHGVLQLGSLEDLPEDAQMANYIKDELITHQYFMGYSDSFVTNEQFPSQSPSLSMSTMMECLNDDLTTFDNVNWSNHKMLTKSFVTPTCDTWHSSHLAGTEVIESSKFLSFPKECELHKALGPAFMGKANDSFQQLSIGKDLDDSSSTKTNGMVTSVLGNALGQAKRKNPNEESAFKGKSSLYNNSVTPAIFSRVKNHNDSSSPSAISYEGVVDELTEEEEQKSKHNVLHQSIGISKPCVASKRRAKPGSKPKPRPRDRQLIQDRLKDLRELVPDGAKCSIDGLLDRTIKHMIFLKSVGDRAMKLRDCVRHEGVGTGPKNNRTTEDKGSQNGASWALELGGDEIACPILVEDLQYPGHMIIEMICDESSRILEIAEVIHGLNLTILNGATERRSGNTWARYIVEAPRGFHRLDIFWPLMKLLQQQQHNPISSKI